MIRRHFPAFATLLLSACSPSGSSGGADETTGDPSAPSEGEVRAILQAHLDQNPACTPFFAMPREVPADASHEQKRMDAFADAGLVQREDGGAARYGFTAEGAKYIRPGTGALSGDKSVICYGRYAIGKIAVGSVDPVIGTANVTYRYTLEDAAPWLNAPAIDLFYPGFRTWRAEREAEDQHETLRWREGKWVVDQPTGPAMYDLRQLGH